MGEVYSTSLLGPRTPVTLRFVLCISGMYATPIYMAMHWLCLMGIVDPRIRMKHIVIGQEIILVLLSQFLQKCILP